MYFIAISENSVTTDDLEQLLKSWKPGIQCSYTQSKRMEMNRETGKFKTEIQKIIWVSTDKFTGAKVFIQSGFIYLKPAVRKIGFGGVIKLILGAGSKSRMQFAKDAALYLAKLTGGVAKTKYGAVSEF
ncbi:MAG: hypothetical protein IPM74_11360 [Crocinitomicaceae bacterium]|nr:hypothetical protein [Crocinitomicaceae bacterium]MBK8926480.1 hypothetical protein [Crocinitomicaceae bacterium]